MCTKYIISIGLFTMAVPATANAGLVDTPDSDLTELINQITLRRERFAQGTVSYEFYRFITDDRYYDELSELLSKPGEECFGDWQSALRNDRVRPRVGYLGYIAFNGDRLAFAQDRIDEFTPGKGRIEQEAARAQARPVVSPSSKRILFHRNKDIELELIDFGSNAMVFVRNRNTLPGLPDIDVTFREWEEVVAKGPNPDQSITASTDGNTARITFATNAGPNRRSAVEYEFQPSLGYAPIGIRGTKNDLLDFVISYAYSDPKPSGSWIPCAVLYGRFQRNGSVLIDLWVVKAWSDELDDRDLALKVPQQKPVNVVDQRPGKKYALPEGLDKLDFNILSDAIPELGSE